MRQGWITRSRYDEAQHNVNEARERLANARADGGQRPLGACHRRPRQPAAAAGRLCRP